MSTWLLDTNIISDMMRNPTGRAMQAIVDLKKTAPFAHICTSLIVDCELQFGLTKTPSQQRQMEYDQTLPLLMVQDLDKTVTEHYARLRTELERAGTPIGANDMLIAAHALALDATLVTDNDSEFRRIPSLKVENWLRQETSSL
jgi:tRNA(fMet)-specific endonuclease VapC